MKKYKIKYARQLFYNFNITFTYIFKIKEIFKMILLCLWISP